MKRLFAIALLSFIVTSTTYAQLQQGFWLLGGDASYKKLTFGQLSTQKQQIFQTSPTIGFFVLDKLAVGVLGNYTSSRTTSDTPNFPDSLGTNKRYGIGAFTRYYLLPVDNKLNVFTEASYNRDFFPYSKEINIDQNRFTGTLGLSYFLTPNIGLNLQASYSKFKLDEELRNNKWNSDFTTSIGFSIHLGK